MVDSAFLLAVNLELAACFFGLNPAQCELPTTRAVVEQLTRAQGINVTVVKSKYCPKEKKTEVTLTFEFGRELTKQADVDAVAEMFKPRSSSEVNTVGTPLVFHLFDKENVSIGKYVITRAVEGELTGLKGDAFRVTIVCDTEKFSRAKKIEARMANPPPR